MVKAVMVDREAVVIVKPVQIGNSWFSVNEVVTFGTKTAHSLYASGHAKPYVSPARHAAEQNKQVVASDRKPSENRQIAMRPKLTPRATTKGSK